MLREKWRECEYFKINTTNITFVPCFFILIPSLKSALYKFIITDWLKRLEFVHWFQTMCFIMWWNFTSHSSVLQFLFLKPRTAFISSGFNNRCLHVQSGTLCISYKKFFIFECLLFYLVFNFWDDHYWPWKMY